MICNGEGDGGAVICTGEVMKEIEMVVEEICRSTVAMGKQRRKDKHRWNPH